MATITAVGSLAVSSASFTIAVSPTTLGDILVVWHGSTLTTSDNITGISGGGVTTWSPVAGGGGGSKSGDIYWGIITTTGASTVTCTYTSGAATNAALASLQFTVTGAGTWSAYVSGNIGGTSAGTTYGILGATLTIGQTGLMLGEIVITTTPVGGSTSGVTYFNPIGATGNEKYMQVVYQAFVSGSGANPAWTQGSSGAWGGCHGLLLFSVSVATVVQKNQAVSRASFR